LLLYILLEAICKENITGNEGGDVGRAVAVGLVGCSAPVNNACTVGNWRKKKSS
jgi:hypothetical protein